MLLPPVSLYKKQMSGSLVEVTVGSGYLHSRAFGSVRKAMQIVLSQLTSGIWINYKYHERHTVWHSWLLDGTQQERKQCYLLWAKNELACETIKWRSICVACFGRDSISFYRTKRSIVKKGAWPGLVEKII